MAELDESRIADGLLHGDPGAWSALYEAFAERIWRIIARLIGPNSADVADVVQETFLAASRSAASYQPALGSLWSWLTGIARRQVALHYRKQSRHDRVKEAAVWPAARNGELARWLRVQDDTALGDLATKELAHLVRTTLLELPSEQEALLTARYLDDVEVADIARQDGVSIEVVHSRLSRARRAFRALFAKFSNPLANDHERPALEFPG